MRFAVLTPAELRLLDMMLERGVFPDPPASITRMDVNTAARADARPGDFPHLRARIPEIVTISRPLSGVLAHGSIADLLRLVTPPPRRPPASD